MFNAPAPPGWGLLLRPRVEQRFAEGSNKTGYRVRLLSRAAYSFQTGLVLVLWDGVFYQLNDTDWQALAGFDRNRAFAGVGLPAIGGSRVDVGYVNAFIKRMPVNHVDHNLAVNLF